MMMMMIKSNQTKSNQIYFDNTNKSQINKQMKMKKITAKCMKKNSKTTMC